MVWDFAGRFNGYVLPHRAGLLAGDERLRRAILKWALRYVVGGLGVNGLAGARETGVGRRPEPTEAECDAMEEGGLLHMLRYLTMCTATPTYGCHSYSLKHRAEEAWFDDDGARHADVGNGVAIAAVLMCGGLAKGADGPNAYLTVRAPKTCGAGAATGCGRYMRGDTRARLCSSCRRIPYTRRAWADFSGPQEVAMRAGGVTGRIRARVQHAFPPESDLFGPAPLPPVDVGRDGEWLAGNRVKRGILP